MVDLVRFIVDSLVDNPESIEISKQGNTINIIAGKDEIGKIIGKQGRIAKAIRTVVKAASAKSNSKWSVEITER
ncbi:MAG: KH domain-containing protein [Christensenellales bacterium]|jgi:predicted RNA-binding protein YlqC (UPF0109 family)